MVRPGDYVVALHDVDHDDKYFVGDKAARLGNMINADFSVPLGFTITPSAYFKFLDHNNLQTKINHLLGAIDHRRDDSLQQVANYIKKHILSAEIPQEIVEEVVSHYEKIGSPQVTLHTTIISGDHEQEQVSRKNVYKSVRGDAAVLDLLRQTWAQMFEPALISHRHIKELDHLKSGIAIVVQREVTPDISGKIYTNDPYSQDKSKLMIEVGSGDALKTYVVDRDTYEVSHRTNQNEPTVFVKDGVQHIQVFDKLGKHEIVALSNLALQAEKYYYFPQLIEWAKEGDKFYILNISSQPFYVKN